MPCDCGNDLTGSPFMFLHPVSPTFLSQAVLKSVDGQLKKTFHRILLILQFMKVKWIKWIANNVISRRSKIVRTDPSEMIFIHT